MKTRVTITILVTLLGCLYCGKKAEITEKKQTTQVLSALVTFAKGEAVVERAGQKIAARVNTIIQASDVLTTGKGGSIDFMLKGYGVIKVGPNSRLQVTSILKGADSSNAELKLEKGNVASFVNRRRKKDSFKIRTPTAIAGVRGTAFLVSVKEQSASSKSHVRIAVLSGSVAVNLPDQDELVLGKNTQVEIDGFQKISRNMIRPLSPGSLKVMKELAVFHKSNVLEYNSLISDVQSNLSRAAALEGDTVKKASKKRDRKISRSFMKNDTVTRARKSDTVKHVKRDISAEHIKLNPKSTYKQ